ncbi:SAM-dependent methyltransferase [Acinetobacter towneri]|uniref:SAM-dependent methyltransferase n=1 Tax=Acinetobacter towneri TaxID=202956 RepID=UPI001444821C|nr:class I SAM-dependent methyltransferase [Acinetobacter towneri]MDM1487419.1 class I SAM-dependent methyltransferase [Acinetobacter towneri]
MKWQQAFRSYFPKHKYAIQAVYLGDNARLPWSNLGYWSDAVGDDYPAACQNLAAHLAAAVHLNSKDRLLDLGCGQGASLIYWLEHYQIQYLEAVDLQAACVQHVRENLNSNLQIHHASFLNLKTIFPQPCFDVVLCIDAAYHSHLNSFLDQVSAVLNSNGRLGFHCLIWADQAPAHLLKQLQYRALLKAADVHFDDLMSETQLCSLLQQHHFQQIQIEDLSTQVLAGFAQYVNLHLQHQGKFSDLDSLKIAMTARLCAKLYADGWVKYVQVSAVKD